MAAGLGVGDRVAPRGGDSSIPSGVPSTGGEVTPRCHPAGDTGPGDIRARAVQELLERIRGGIVLRPARERPPPRQVRQRRQSRQRRQRRPLQRFRHSRIPAGSQRQAQRGAGAAADPGAQRCPQGGDIVPMSPRCRRDVAVTPPCVAGSPEEAEPEEAQREKSG